MNGKDEDFKRRGMGRWEVKRGMEVVTCSGTDFSA